MKLAIIGGWQLHDGDYAETLAGSSWMEIQDNGDLLVKVDSHDSDNDTVIIPAAVWREVVRGFDAKGKP